MATLVTKDNPAVEAAEKIEALIKKIDKYVRSAVSAPRYKHSVRTAALCEKLCLLHGVDGRRGYLVGLAHDMCKDMDNEQLIAYAMKDGAPITVLEAEKPPLLHGRAAAVLLDEEFAVSDADILEAVAHHTFGKKNAAPLTKILFVADKIEPGREHITESERTRLLKLPLDALVKSVITDSIRFLNRKGKPVAEATLDFLSSL